MCRTIPILLVLAVVCLADSAMMFEFPDGRTVAMISNNEISMAAESVYIEPSGGIFSEYSDENGWLPHMEVRCIFELVNSSDEEQFVTVGFPFDAKFGHAYTAMDEEMLAEELSRSFDGENRPEWENHSIVGGMDAMEDVPEELDFRTFIDGEEVEVVFRKCALSLEEGLIWRPVVAVWKMKFAPRETIMLENTYNTSWDYIRNGPWSFNTINYILTSGGTWSGPIGDAVVTLTLPDEMPDPTLNDTLLCYWHWTGQPVVDGRTIRWHYRDFEPDENISFSVEEGMQLGFWENSINPERMYNTVVWTEDELLSSAVDFLSEGNFWGIQSNTRLTLRILEALPWLIQGAEPPNGIMIGNFFIPEVSGEVVIAGEMQRRLDLVYTLQNEMERNRDSASDAGYLEFLPIFVSNYQWDLDDLGMFGSMPERERRYLDLLLEMEKAVAGEYIDNPAVRSFYELTGWYSEGRETGLSALSEASVGEYRESH